ncbi:MAG: hypothetical protein WB630_15055 [Candidatus Acidiferrales bacterium]
MSSLRLLLSSGSVLGLGALLLGVSGCGGSGSVSSTPPASPSYTLKAGSLNPGSVTAGNTSTSTITVTPAGGYTGNVSLSCSMIAGGTPAPSCSFSSPSVMIANDAAVTSTLTVSTSANTPGGTYTITVVGSDGTDKAPSNGAQTLSLTTAAAIQHIVVIFQENRTPDNLFQDPVLIGRGADIASSGLNSTGQTIPLSPIDLGTTGSSPQNYDLSHAHAAFVSMYDGGKMDGANLIPCTPAAACPPNAHPNPQYNYVFGLKHAVAEGVLLGQGKVGLNVGWFERAQLSCSPVHPIRHFSSYGEQQLIRRRKSQ